MADELGIQICTRQSVVQAHNMAAPRASAVLRSACSRHSSVPPRKHKRKSTLPLQTMWMPHLQTMPRTGSPGSSVHRLAADVAAAGEAAGSVLTGLGWGYTQGVINTTSAARGGTAGAGAGLPQVSPRDRPGCRRHGRCMQAVVILDCGLMAAFAGIV